MLSDLYVYILKTHQLLRGEITVREKAVKKSRSTLHRLLYHLSWGAGRVA